MNYGQYFVETAADTSVLRRRTCAKPAKCTSRNDFYRFKNTGRNCRQSTHRDCHPVVRRMQPGHCMSLLRLFVAIKLRQNELISTILVTLNLKDINYSLAHSLDDSSVQQPHSHVRRGERPHGMISFDRQCSVNGEVRSLPIGHGIVNNLVQLTQI